MPIDKSTLKFLKDLEKNNNRDWFQDHKDQYILAQNNMKDIAGHIQSALNKKDEIADARVFRIYRDVRFSKDKSPYKNNLGIHFTRATAHRRGGYYLHIQPGGSFAGGGFWAPSPDDLKRIREEFAFDAKPILKIISSTKFFNYFGQLQGEELKTAPAGFDKNHPDIDLIRKKSFTIMRSFKDKEVLDPGFQQEVVKTFEAMRPYFDYMTEILIHDKNGQKII
jgi:uncharacterized protein (TIGR02453 family)